MEPLQLAVIPVELCFSECTDILYRKLGMCGKFYIVSCCGGSTVVEEENKRTSSSSNRTRRRQRSNSENSEGRPAGNSEQPVDPATINVNFVSPHTMKLLTDIREIKEYKQAEMDNDELQKALKIHGDILARLENPTKYT